MIKAAKKLKVVAAVVLILLNMNFIHAQALSGSFTGHFNSTCFGTCNGSLTVTATGGNGSYSYSWVGPGAFTYSDPGPGNGSTVSGLCPGTYTVTITDGLAATYTLTSNVLQPTDINLNMTGTSQTICSGNSASICPNVTGGTSPYTFSWTPQTDLNNPFAMCPVSTATTTTTHTFTVTDAQGCVKTASTTLTVNPTPNVGINASGSTTICRGGSVTLTGTGATAYSWAPTTGLSTSTSASTVASPTTTTVYTVTGNSLGCVNSASVTVVVNTAHVVFQTPNPICEGDSAYLQASGAVSYSWSPAAYLSATTGPFVKSSPPNTTYPYPTRMTYTVTGTDNNGCVDTDTASVVVNIHPFIVLTPNVAQICEGDSVMIINQGWPCDTYMWTGGDGELNNAWNDTVYAHPSQTSSYFVTGFLNGCQSSSGGPTSAVITVYPKPVVSVSPLDTTICAGTSTPLAASSTGGTGSITYSWLPATDLNTASGANVSTSATTDITYTVTATDANGCSDTATSAITVIPLPLMTVNPSNPTICAGDSVTFTAGGGVTYIWIPGNTTLPNPTFSPATSTSYTLVGMDANGCMTTLTNIAITVLPSPTASIASYTEPSCGGTDGLLNATASGGTPAYMFVWQPGAIMSQVVTGLGAGTYSLVVTDMNGCVDSLSYTLSDSCEVVWPGDADNDLIANNNDILDIGLNYGGTGPARLVQGNSWMGYPAADFAVTKANGFNQKHDDCNGDGIIDVSDTTAVIANYNFTHPQYKLINQVQVTGTPLSLEFTMDSTVSASPVVMKINLGSNSMPASNVYGLSLTLSIDTTIVAQHSALNTSNSWLSAGSPVFLENLIENYSNSQIDIALCRTDHSNKAGNGEVGEVVFIMKDDISGKFMSSLDKILQVNIVRSRVISANGDTVSVTASGDTIEVSQVTGIETLDKTSAITAYPNPAKDVVNFISSKTNLQKAELYAMEGRLVLVHEEKSPAALLSINTDKLDKGIYFAKIYTAGGVKVMRIVLY